MMARLEKTVRSKTNFLAGYALLAFGALFGCGPAAAPKPSIEHMLATAKTASDHEAIAEYYENEAAHAHTEYEEHEKSASQYAHSAKWRGMAGHCARLAQDYEQAEHDASTLAAQHRKVAVEMRSGSEMSTASPAISGSPAKQTH